MMHLPTPHFRPMPFYAKALAVVMIVALVVLGIIGIMLPVIPGVIFLFLAALLATRVSRRASSMAHNSPWYREQLRAWQASRHLPARHKLSLSLLIAARALVAGIAVTLRFIGGVLRSPIRGSRH